MNLISQQEATEKALKAQQELYYKPFGLWGLDFGIHDVNILCGGLIPGQVITIAIRSGGGKSAMIVPISKAAERVQNGRRAMLLVFTWEMEPATLVDRYVCHLLQIEMKKLKFGIKLFNREQLANLKRAYEAAKNLPIVYQQMAVDINKLREIVLRFMENEVAEEERKTGLKIQPIIIIDYLGIAKYPGQQSRTHDISDFTIGIKQLAKEIGGTVVQFSQVKRESDQKDLPDIGDIPESSYIENNSDCLLIGHRPEHLGRQTVYDPDESKDVDSTNKMLIMAVKARFLGIGNKLINADVATNTFWSLHHDRFTEYWHQYESAEYWKRMFNFK